MICLPGNTASNYIDNRQGSKLLLLCKPQCSQGIGSLSRLTDHNDQCLLVQWHLPITEL